MYLSILYFILFSQVLEFEYLYLLKNTIRYNFIHSTYTRISILGYQLTKYVHTYNMCIILKLHSYYRKLICTYTFVLLFCIL